MSTLSVTTVQSANGTTDLTLQTGNTSNPGIVVSSSTGTARFGNTSFGATSVQSTSNSGAAIVGLSNTQAGVAGYTNTAYGVFAQANATGYGVYAISNTGTGAYVQSNTGTIATFANATTTIATVNATGAYVTGTISATNAAISTNTLTLGTSATTANGYTRLPNGLLLQWMNVTAVPTTVNAAGAFVSFPIAFTTVLNVTAIETGSASGKAIAISSSNTTGATLIVTNTAGRPGSAYVTAIGL